MRAAGKVMASPRARALWCKSARLTGPGRDRHSRDDRATPAPSNLTRRSHTKSCIGFSKSDRACEIGRRKPQDLIRAPNVWVETRAAPTRLCWPPNKRYWIARRAGCSNFLVCVHAKYISLYNCSLTPTSFSLSDCSPRSKPKNEWQGEQTLTARAARVGTSDLTEFQLRRSSSFQSSPLEAD